MNSLWSKLRGRTLMLGLGAAGSAVGAISGDQVFAKQFVCDGLSTKLPAMVYDPGLQVMVDPVSGQPIYEDAKKLRLANPTVTAGCSDCPKKDD
jgi:hypothetical protein